MQEQIDQDVRLLNVIKAYLIEANHGYHNQFKVKTAGFFESAINAVTSVRQGVNKQDKGVGVLIEALDEIDDQDSEELRKCLLPIFLHADFGDDNLGGKSMARHLFDAVNKNPHGEYDFDEADVPSTSASRVDARKALRDKMLGKLLEIFVREWLKEKGYGLLRVDYRENLLQECREFDYPLPPNVDIADIYRRHLATVGQPVYEANAEVGNHQIRIN